MGLQKIRKPIVSGRFYSSNPKELREQLAGFIIKGVDKIDALGVISPHAGFSCSGVVAGELFSSIKPRSTYVILGPNHTGLGKPFGLDPDRVWKTPLGEVQIDTRIAQKILKKSRYIKEDYVCHDDEHSIEVQLPFLQYLNPNFKFVPIVIASGNREIYAGIG
ncbi:MAG: AmmeMemoRadiSam system protein B, partial [Candidatus Omnitrophota bacterium]